MRSNVLGTKDIVINKIETLPLRVLYFDDVRKKSVTVIDSDKGQNVL